MKAPDRATMINSEASKSAKRQNHGPTSSSPSWAYAPPLHLPHIKPSAASFASQDTLNNEGYKVELHESNKDSIVSHQSSQILTVESMHHKVGIEPASQTLKDSVMTNSRCYPATTYAD